ATVRGGERDRDERQHGVALLDVIFDPFLVDRDVAFEKMEALVRQPIRDAVGLHIHPVDIPIRRVEDPPRQMVADEACDAEDQDFFHGSSEEWPPAAGLGVCSKRSSFGANVGMPRSRSRYMHTRSL